MATVFVYGTLLTGQANWARYLKDKAKLLGKDTTKGIMVSLNYFPAVVTFDPRFGIIHGELYEVDQQVLASLDMLEGYNPNTKTGMYKRVDIKVASGLSEVQAYEFYEKEWCAEKPLIPHGDWLRFLKEQKPNV